MKYAFYVSGILVGLVFGYLYGINDSQIGDQQTADAYFAGQEEASSACKGPMSYE